MHRSRDFRIFKKSYYFHYFENILKACPLEQTFLEKEEVQSKNALTRNMRFMYFFYFQVKTAFLKCEKTAK